MKYTLTFILFIIVLNSKGQNHSYLKKEGTATQLMVNDEPFIILGGELGNSSASSVKDIELIFPKLKKMELNTVLVPAYWDMIEPEENKFDFELTDKILQEARKNNLKVIFLWFGTWKNSMSCYTPLWFKKDFKKYPRAYTKNGKPMEIASMFSENVFNADSKAFRKWLSHIYENDKSHNTVLMIQIENEIGMLEDARDYSVEANKQFNKEVPGEFLNYLSDNRKKLHPSMLKKWESKGCKSNGSWQEVFGKDVYTDELFMAWNYAIYIEKMAKIARQVYNVPLYVNAAMNSRSRKPGEYPSAGPLAHLIDIWHCAAPNIDFIAPDLYDNGFVDWVSKYKLNNNPLFIPELKLSDNDGVRAFYVIGEHDAIGISPFSIEDYGDNSNLPLVKGYAKLNEIMPIVIKSQGKGIMRGMLFDKDNQETTIINDDIKITGRHFFTLPWDSRSTDGSEWAEGGGLLIKFNKYEYILSGKGIVIEFKDITENSVKKELGEDGFVNNGNNNDEIYKWNGKKRIGIGEVNEIEVDKDGEFKIVRKLNGDQTHQGRHVRIGVDEFKTLYVKLYEYK